MIPPKFWHNPPESPGLTAKLLGPLAWAYAKATSTRVAKHSAHKASVPVICVGNINVGGTGKTPFVIAIVEHLQELGHAPHVVSRGYKGQLSGPVQVNERSHRATDVGDEPLLLAAFAPTWVARDRAEGVKLAEAAGAEIIILDDGFQNPSVQKDLSIVVVDATHGFGNGRVMPAGPLREPVQIGLKRADILLSLGGEPAQQDFETDWASHIDLPRLHGALVPLETGMDWQGLNVLAFAGIGHPEKFFATLADLGANIIHAEPLEDHQELSPALMKRLETEATAKHAQLVTTEKDAVRLPKSFRSKVLTLPVRLRLDDWAELDKALTKLAIKAT